MPRFLNSICAIISVYDKYAQPNGEGFLLSCRVIKRLILKEFAEAIENPHDPPTLEWTLQLLDSNGLVDFNEYLLLIFRVAKACSSPLQPRERGSQKQEVGRAPCPENSEAPRKGEPRGDENPHCQLQDDEREGNDVHGRRDSEQMSLHPTEVITRREERRDDHPAESRFRVDGRSPPICDLELRDHCRRYRQPGEPWDQEDQYNPRPELETQRWRLRSESSESCDSQALENESERRRRRSQSSESEASENERRRLQWAEPRKIEREAEWSQLHPREAEWSQLHPREAEWSQLHPREAEWSQLHPREAEWSQLHPREPISRDAKQRQCQQRGRKWREDEQRRTHKRYSDPRDSEQQRRTQQYDSSCWEDEQQQDVDTQDSEQQRMQQHYTDPLKREQQRRTQQCQADPRNAEQHRRRQRRDSELGAAEQERRRQQYTDLQDGEQQRRTQQCNSDCWDKPKSSHVDTSSPAFIWHQITRAAPESATLTKSHTQ